MKAKLSEAPGCFGAPLVRAQNHQLCTKCSWRTPCAKFAVVNGKRMQDELNVPHFDYQRAFQSRNAAKPVKLPSIDGLSINAANLVRSLHKKGIDKEDLRRILYLSPNDVLKDDRIIKPRYLRVFITLLSIRNAVSRAELIQCFEKHLGWSHTTAASHAAIITSALSHLDVIAIQNDMISRKQA